jgi:hypothetical protein
MQVPAVSSYGILKQAFKVHLVAIADSWSVAPHGYFLTTWVNSAANPTNMKVTKKVWDIFSNG